MLEAPEAPGKACKAQPIAQEAAQIANGGQTMVAEKGLAEGTVLGVLPPQLAVGVGALVASRHLPAQTPLLLHPVQGPHGSCGAGLQPAGIDGGQHEVQQQQAKLAGWWKEDKVSHAPEAGGVLGRVLLHPQSPEAGGRWH